MNQSATNLNVGMDQTTPIVCEECGNETFTQALYLRRVSALLTGTGQEGVIPIPTFLCSACNHINDKFKIQILPKLEDED